MRVLELNIHIFTNKIFNLNAYQPKTSLRNP